MNSPGVWLGFRNISLHTNITFPIEAQQYFLVYLS
jgi:hypothetical protein